MSILPEDRPLIIYHGDNCPDGWTCFWIAHRFFGDRADYLPAVHQTPPPDVAARTIYLLDFSYPRDQVRRLISFNRKVTVIDHHEYTKSALANLDNGDGKFKLIFDASKAGCRLAWEFFYPKEPVPWLVDYAETRDLWRFDLPFSHEAWICGICWTELFQPAFSGVPF